MKLLSTPPAWDSTPPEVWHQWQTRRLRQYLETRVLPFSTHYRRLFQNHGFHPSDLRSLADWTHAPFTTKADLTVPRDQQRDFVLMPSESVLQREPSMWMRALVHGRQAAKDSAEDEFRPVMLTSTTGRSSDPVPFVYTRHDLRNLDRTGLRLMQAGRSQRDWRHMNLFPFAPHLAFWQTHHAGLALGAFMVSTGGGKTLGTEGNLRLLDKVKPHVVIGMPTFLYHTLRQAVEQRQHWPDLKRIVLGGEKVASGLRARLRELADELGSPDVHVLSTYGFTEAKMALPECVSHNGIGISGFHLSPDLGIIELIDPKTLRPVAPGQPGEVVFTPLDARGTVVMRYRTGDLAEGGLTWERCPHCGRTTPRLLGPISRVSEVRELHLDKIKGTLVNFNVLEHLLDDQRSIAAWQLELRKKHNDPHEVDEVILHLAPETRSDPDQLEKLVRRRFMEATEIMPNEIQIHPLADLRQRLGVGRLMKEEKLLDRRSAAAPTTHPLPA